MIFFSHVALWSDSTTLRTYVFGGTGLSASSGTAGLLSDLWSWKLGETAWISIGSSGGGSAIANARSTFSIEGVSDNIGWPAARQSPATWLHSDGVHFAMFGGLGDPKN